MTKRWVAALILLGLAPAASATETAPLVPVAPLSPAPPPLLVVEAAAPAPLPLVVEAAPAPRETRAAIAPLAGTLTMLVPFAVGCALWSNSTRDDFQKAGTVVMAAGFAAAPIVSHGLAGSWRRAAAFGSVSVATSAATLVAMELKDPFYPPFTNRQRVPFGMLLTSSLFAAAVGVFDSFRTVPRERP
jgi:hypothetical protein